MTDPIAQHLPGFLAHVEAVRPDSPGPPPAVGEICPVCADRGWIIVFAKTRVRCRRCDRGQHYRYPGSDR